MTSLLRRGVAAAAAMLIAVGAVPLAFAQAAFPEKPIFVVVPYPPGGPNDLVARAISEELGNTLGQAVVVDNRGGAGGNVGTEYVVGADADGYTLLLHATPLVVNPILYDTARYDAIEDLSPVGTIVEAPLVLVVPDDFPVNSVEELVAYLKENPGEVTFGTGGAGTGLHLAAVQFMGATDTDMVHIPYQGNAMVIPDLLSGKINVLFSAIGTALPHIESGAVRALGVTTSSRSDVLPDVPTIAEAGVDDFSFSSWFVLVAPGDTPLEVRETINAALNDVLANPAVVETFARMAYVPIAGSVEETEGFIADQTELWSDLIERFNITVE